MLKEILIHLVVTPIISGLVAYLVVRATRTPCKDWSGWMHLKPKDPTWLNVSSIANNLEVIDMSDIGDACKELHVDGKGGR